MELNDRPESTQGIARSDDNLHSYEQDGNRYALPPSDKGSQAWLCLAGCFMANVLVWGLALSYGILQEYYTTHEPFSSHPDGIPAVGTTATGVSYLTMPIFFLLYRRWPRARTYSLYASLFGILAALIGASFANTVGQLLFCQGVLYALAGNALVVPTIAYLNEWFVRRKGLAVGIMWSGDGVGGLIMPLLLNALLARVGFRWTLRIVAGMIVLLMAPFLLVLRPRLPQPLVSVSRPFDTSFLRGPLFWILQLFNMLQALGYFMPANYLPSYAQSLGYNSTFGSLTVLMINLASIFGCISVGALADRFEITTILLFISIISSFAVSVVWGVSISLAPLLVFCVIYGLSASAYSTTWGGMVIAIQKRNEGVDTSMLFGLMAAGRGIGVVASGPLSEALLRTSDHLQATAGLAYGSEYAPVIIFSACTSLVGGGSWVCRRAGII